MIDCHQLLERLKDNKETPTTRNFTAGGFGGACMVASGYPFDTIKVHLQTMSVPKPGKAPIYSGAFDCFVKIVKIEGIQGLYKGMSAPIAASIPIAALGFSGYALGKTIQQSDPNQELSSCQLLLAGAISGLLRSFVVIPVERIKCVSQVQQAQTSHMKYSGPVDIVKRLWLEGGIRNIYKGTCVTLLREIPSTGVFFGGYEILLKMMISDGGDKSELNVGKTIFAGGMAGVFGWIVALPPDILKSRLQTASEGYYQGVLDVFHRLLKTEGIAALYKGWSPVMLRAFPANACCFLGYETAMRVLS